MAGIYLHIPFCAQACHYCDFHFSTSLQLKKDLIDALIREIEQRKNYLPEKTKIKTIYLGGGTPSLLSDSELMKLIDKLYSCFEIDEMAEITMEANPEDLTKEKIKQFRTTPVNRFRIGVQSFFQNDLDFMNRIHSAEKSIDAIKRTQDAGFQNITIDLIYGTPTLTNENWKKNLEIAFDLRVKHISAYCLTVEEKTALHHFITSGKIKKLDEEKSAEQFELLQKMMLSNHFVQYEISNFCTENYFSKHNSNYWKQIPYIGLGPSAHSFDGASRQWNVRNNAKYIELVEQKKEYFEKEQLTEVQLYNEFVMTGLRTMWGLDLKQLEIKFGRNKRMFCVNSAKSFIEKDWIKEVSEHYILSDEGKLFADKIASDLFYTEN